MSMTNVIKFELGIGDRLSHYFDDPLKQSPCDCRPDNFLNCPLLEHPKENIICATCQFIGNGKHNWTVPEILERINRGDLFSGYVGEKPGKKQCKWPHGKCQNGANLRGKFKDKYCHHHSVVLTHRMAHWPEHRWFEPVKQKSIKIMG